MHHGLHERYGALVRIAPDEVSVSDPHAIDVIARPDFLKSDFYSTFDPGFGGRPEPFAERDPHIHTQHKKIITPLFRSEAVLEYEDYIDEILKIFDEHMAIFAENETIFNLANYFERCTWDTVGGMVYSKTGGFGMLKGEDCMGWMEMIRVMPQPMSSLGYVPYGFNRLYFLSMLAFSPQTRKGIMSALTVRKQVQALVKRRKNQEAAGNEFPQNECSRR
jgi:Cytochrome P450